MRRKQGIIESAGRKAVLRVLAARHDHFATQQQLLVEQGRYAEAEGAGRYAEWVLRAYRDELDDIKPAGLP